MNKLTINPNNRKYYSKDFIKGFECGVERQYEKDKAELTPIVRGKWINRGDMNDGECSVCKKLIRATDSANFKYCPNCGAKMKESEDKE